MGSNGGGVRFRYERIKKKRIIKRQVMQHFLCWALCQPRHAYCMFHLPQIRRGCCAYHLHSVDRKIEAQEVKRGAQDDHSANGRELNLNLSASRTAYEPHSEPHPMRKSEEMSCLYHGGGEGRGVGGDLRSSCFNGGVVGLGRRSCTSLPQPGQTCGPWSDQLSQFVSFPV